MDDGAIRCTECKREVDEFTAIAEGWRYWSDGCSELMPFCPECARREFAPEAPASGLVPLVHRRASSAPSRVSMGTRSSAAKAGFVPSPIPWNRMRVAALAVVFDTIWKRMRGAELAPEGVVQAN